MPTLIPSFFSTCPSSTVVYTIAKSFLSAGRGNFASLVNTFTGAPGEGDGEGLFDELSELEGLELSDAEADDDSLLEAL